MRAICGSVRARARALSRVRQKYSRAERGRSEFHEGELSSELPGAFGRSLSLSLSLSFSFLFPRPLPPFFLVQRILIHFLCGVFFFPSARPPSPFFLFFSSRCVIRATGSRYLHSLLRVRSGPHCSRYGGNVFSRCVINRANVHIHQGTITLLAHGRLAAP